MSKTKYYAVIGKNFGDEGKGLATDYLCRTDGNVLGVRHNGGAQSGHTVSDNGKRFVFHELSSGSMQNADTLWAETYHPDLYKLKEERDAFVSLTGKTPKVFVSDTAGFTVITDVLINMALETSRGDKRHGSCGMGIYECCLRENAGYKVTCKDFLFAESFSKKLERISKEYVPERLSELGLKMSDIGEYGELLESNAIRANFAEECCRNLEMTSLVNSSSSLFLAYDRIVFEGGQGLLLDEDCERFAPNISASKTGLKNIEHILGKSADCVEAFYVTRSYVTRHGAGILPFECDKSCLGNISEDETNIKNDWQGSIRYAPHESFEMFSNPVLDDLGSVSLTISPNLFITHLNETSGHLIFSDGFGSLISVSPDELMHEACINSVFSGCYTSFSRNSDQTGQLY